MKLNSMTLSNPVFPDGINSFQCPLGKIYSKIMSYTIILSSYQCDSTDYFGFKLSISIMTNPAATVNVTLEQTLNSKFSIIGVSAIIVTEPFDQVMKFLQFDMKIKEQWQTKSFPIPANYEWHFFVKSVSEKMIGNGFSQFTVSTYNRVSFILPTTVRMYFYSTTDYSSNAENYSFQVVLIILDLTAKDSFP